MRLDQPAWLLLLPLLLIPWLAHARRLRLSWPTTSGFSARSGLKARVAPLLPPFLLSLAVIAAILALARPQTIAGRTRLPGQGISIILLLDRSRSMLAPIAPAGPTRLDAAKQAINDFLRNRPDDLIGLVAFANSPDLSCPLTRDHQFLSDVVQSLQVASSPVEDGTSIGNALVWALEALDQTPTTERVALLLTDGENNPQGTLPAPIDPRSAARLAGELGVKLYTIALGRPGGQEVFDPTTGLRIPSSVKGPDLELLADIARLGQGQALTAWDLDRLQEAYRTIDSLERSDTLGTILTRYQEWFPACLAFAVVAISSATLLQASWSHTTP